MKKYLTLILLLQIAAAGLATNAGGTANVTEDDFPHVIDCAYLIGSFNDWKLPDGDDLNGAKKIVHYRESWRDCNYRWTGSLPAGDVSFMVYVPELANLTDADYSGFYTYPCRQFPLYEPNQEYFYMGVDDLWCERSSAPNISKACMIPDWAGDEVTVQFSTCPRDYMEGLCFKLSVGGKRRQIQTPGFYYFIGSVNGGETEVIKLSWTYFEGKYPRYFRGYYSGEIYDVTTVSGYFSPEPSPDIDASRCLGAAGPDTFTLDPSVNIAGVGYKEMTWQGALYLAPGKKPITINIIGGEDLYIRGLNIYNWTVEFSALDLQISVADISDDSPSQVQITDHTVTVPSPARIEVYSLDGVRVRSDYGTRLGLGDLAHGTYIVRAGALSRKVAL